MNNKDASSKNQSKNNTYIQSTDKENGTYVDPNIGRQDGSSNYPFYTPPGEGPQPRITSN